MTLKPPPKVRTVLYIFTTLGAPVVIYLSDRAIIGPAEVSLWTGFTMAITAMAGLNVKK